MIQKQKVNDSKPKIAVKQQKPLIRRGFTAEGVLVSNIELKKFVGVLVTKLEGVVHEVHTLAEQVRAVRIVLAAQSEDEESLHDLLGNNNDNNNRTVVVSHVSHSANLVKSKLPPYRGMTQAEALRVIIPKVGAKAGKTAEEIVQELEHGGYHFKSENPLNSIFATLSKQEKEQKRWKSRKRGDSKYTEWFRVKS